MDQFYQLTCTAKLIILFCALLAVILFCVVYKKKVFNARILDIFLATRVYFQMAFLLLALLAVLAFIFGREEDKGALYLKGIVWEYFKPSKSTKFKISIKQNDEKEYKLITENWITIEDNMKKPRLLLNLKREDSYQLEFQIERREGYEEGESRISKYKCNSDNYEDGNHTCSLVDVVNNVRTDNGIGVLKFEIHALGSNCFHPR